MIPVLHAGMPDTGWRDITGLFSVVTVGRILVRRIGPFLAWRFSNASSSASLATTALNAHWRAWGTNFYGAPMQYYRNGSPAGTLFFRNDGTTGTTGTLDIAEMNVLVLPQLIDFPPAPYPGVPA